jgi:diguanylate cyclase (GGDEF)-like protein
MIDRLTGLPDLVDLLERTSGFAIQGFPLPLSLAALHFSPLWQVNRTQGRNAGDELLRWCAETLRSGHSGPVFRAGGDKFVLSFEQTNPGEALHAAEQLAENLHQGEKILPFGKSRVAVIHFSKPEEVSPGSIMACLFVALSDRFHEKANGSLVEFRAEEIRLMKDYPWMVVELAEQLMSLGVENEKYVRLAETDSVTQLPNLIAAISAMDKAILKAQEKDEPLAVLLIDGDNLRQYNRISFAAGDQAIQLLATTIKQQIRETDFLARYRSGDEFLVLLPGTNLEKALYIGQRLCWSVERASRAWLLPTTISIGVALFPTHGHTRQELLEQAESRLASAKKQGKNQVRVFK